MSYQILISYASKDRDLAQDLERRLIEVSVGVFLDERSARSGMTWTDQIERAIRESDEFIVLITDNSIHNAGIIFELGVAFSLRKRVTPIIVGVEPTEIRPMLKHLRSIIYSEVEDYISELAKRANTATTAS